MMRRRYAIAIVLVADRVGCMRVGMFRLCALNVTSAIVLNDATLLFREINFLIY